MAEYGISQRQKVTKRIFDLVVSFSCLVAFFWIIILAWIISSIETRSNGMFFQSRIGLHGKPFRIIKIKTMFNTSTKSSTITTSVDARITLTGKLFRWTKIDELPQFWNVLKGEMSIVGPRPDVSGFADKLEGEDRLLLTVKPGITGPASIKYRNEGDLLAMKSKPEEFYAKIIWPDKVKINVEYVKDWSFFKDLKYIMSTIFRC